MDDGLYDADIVEWADRQAGLLRDRLGGRLANEAAVDWANIAEEIESVGRDQVHAVESLLVQAVAHELKAQGWPDSKAAPGWLAEARRFRGDAAARFTPAMRQRIDVARIYRRALRAVPDTVDGVPAPSFAADCPLSLDALLAEG